MTNALAATVGKVFTPPARAAWLLRTWGVLDAWRAGASVCDPTSGDGVFILTLLDMARQSGVEITQEMVQRLALYDADAACILRFRTAARELLPHLDPPPAQARDIILSPPRTRFDLLIGNPPWANFTDLPEEYKEVLKPVFMREGLVADRRMLLLGGARVDIAALVLQIVLGRLLKRRGEAFFYVPLSLFCGDDAHRGFRAYRANARNFAVHTVYEFTRTRVFQDVATAYCCAAFALDRAQTFPVRYLRETLPCQPHTSLNPTATADAATDGGEGAAPAFLAQAPLTAENFSEPAPCALAGPQLTEPLSVEPDLTVLDGASAADAETPALSSALSPAWKHALARALAHGVPGNAPDIHSTCGACHEPSAWPSMWPSMWEEHTAFPLHAPDDAWRIRSRHAGPPPTHLALLPELPRPRQGINTCGANAVFIFDAPPQGIPQNFLYPLATSAQWADPPGAPRKWMLLPHDRKSGKALTPEELHAHPGLLDYLLAAEHTLRRRKGAIIQSQMRLGRWWALFGVGPYAFAPFKVIWQAYGKRHFAPIILEHVDGQPWQANQAMHAFIPCATRRQAESTLAALRHPAIQDTLRELNGAGRCNWAQPGKMRKVLAILGAGEAGMMHESVGGK